jgi:segregation and condensation protein B
MSSESKLKQIVEAALLAAGRPLSLDQLQALFSVQGAAGTDEGGEPDKKLLREVLESLSEDYAGRGFELREVGSGFRIQVRSEYSTWVSRLYAERPPKYSRALLETLALIAYRQPITRGEIEEIRGVSVSSNIVKTLTEREWVRVVGHRDVPGKPALYATTKEFLDYFNLKSLSELPTLAEIRDLESINRELELKDPDLYQPEAQATEQTAGTGAQQNLTEGEPEAGSQALAESQAPAGETLIEVDPDGETDSGVVRRSPEELERDARVSTEDEPPIELDPDAETGYSGDSSVISEEETKRNDETD